MTVTIEDKIELFSKLIFGNIENESSEKKQKVKEEHQKELIKLSQEVEERKRELKAAAIEKAEKERAKLLAHSKTNQQHLLVDKKQQFLEQIMGRLQQMAADFTVTEEYKTFFERSIDAALRELMESRHVVFYTQIKDIELCRQLLQQRLKNSDHKMEFEVQAAPKDIIGGLIAVDTESLLQLEMNLKALLDENKDTIGAAITRKFNEVSSL